MKIGFIGAGKVGCTLGIYLGKEHEIVGYASRSKSSAEEAAKLTNSQAFDSGLELCELCELVFFTTPDDEISKAWNALKGKPGAYEALHGKTVCHASGSLPSSVFQGADGLGAYALSVHPLYAIASKTETAKTLNEALFVIEGHPERLDELRSIFEIMGNKVQTIETNDKTRYHAAAVLASNHVVALYSLAAKELQKCGFNEEDANRALAPLLLGNAKNIAQDGPVAALTGPAERGDNKTISKHLATLDGRVKNVYQLLNEEALELAMQKHATGN